MKHPAELSSSQRSRILSELKDLFSAGKYQQAVGVADKYLNIKKYPVIDDDDESFHAAILSLRVSAHTMLGETDVAVQYITRNERYLHNKKIDTGTPHRITVINKDLFSFQVDAFIKTMHKTREFDYAPVSSSHQLRKHIPSEEITRQLRNQDVKSCGFLFLEHSDLFAAPYSYHIPVYYDDNKLDIVALESGLVAVLNDIRSRDFADIAIAPLGLSANNTPEEKETTIGVTTKTLLDFLYMIPEHPFPKIYFPCSNPKTYNRTLARLQDATIQGRLENELRQTADKGIREFIKSAKTVDPRFIGLLHRMSLHLYDKREVLLLGESGTGKSFLAKAIHENGPRKTQGRFLQVNCAAIEPSLLASELFGASKGAFTGAITELKGVFEEAGGGTVFLDEIGYAGKDVQASLLTLIDDKLFFRLGDKKEMKIEARLIFGTNANLEQLIDQKRFLHDLYARISNSGKYTIPPLRDRIVDLHLHVEDVLTKLNSSSELPISLESDSLEALSRFSWPGNVRQLRLYIDRLHQEAIASNRNSISPELIQLFPPSEYSPFVGDHLMNLESLIHEFMELWLDNYTENGSSTRKFRHEFISEVLKPIVANIVHLYYDADIPDREKGRILGLDAGGNNRGYDQALRKYPLIRELLYKKPSS